MHTLGIHTHAHMNMHDKPCIHMVRAHLHVFCVRVCVCVRVRVRACASVYVRVCVHVSNVSVRAFAHVE